MGQRVLRTIWICGFVLLLFGMASALTITPARAQDGGSLLERLIEDSLSSDNQQIQVTGLRGALSSKASIDEIAVLDRDGVWLRLTDAVLDWNRAALLRGQFKVNRLSANEISVLRQPGPSPQDPDLPSPEAKPFALPELPVSVEIGALEVATIDLAEPVMGKAAQLSLSGALSLINGTADASLSVRRLDRHGTQNDTAQGDRLELVGRYTNETHALKLDLTFAEAAGGLLSELLGLPDRPDLALSIKGDGPLDDFAADMALDSAGVRRLSGAVTLNGLDSGDGIRFDADLGGNIDAFLAPDFHPFFGPGLRAVLRGQTKGEDVTVESLALRSRALGMVGALDLKAGQLDTANLRLTVTPPDGADRVTLPVSGGQTSLRALELVAQKPLDADWSVTLFADDLLADSLRITRTQLNATGQLDQRDGFSLTGDVRADLLGFDPGDPALAKAIGREVTLTTRLNTQGTDGLALEDLRLSGADYTAAGRMELQGLSAGLEVLADLALEARNVARVSDLVGQSVSGALSGQVKASATPLSGAFEVDLKARGRDLQSGMTQLNPLTTGLSTLDLVAARDTQGIRIDRFALKTAEVSATAEGRLDSDNGQLSLHAELSEIARLVPQLAGAATVTADVTRSGDRLSGTADLLAAGDISLRMEGDFDRSGAADLVFDARVPNAQRFAPQLTGAPLTAKGSIKRRDGVISGQSDLTGPAGTTLALTGTLTEASGDADLKYDLLVGRLQQLLPGLDGALRSEGAAQRLSNLWQIDGRAQGPLGIETTFGGSWDEPSATADIAARGGLRLEGANSFLKPRLIEGPLRFDLTLKGTPSLSNLRGTLSTDGANFVLPGLSQQIRDIAGQIRLDGGRATLAVTARPRDGGTVGLQGPVTLDAPYTADLRVSLADVVLTDKLSYESSLGGEIRLTGALTGNSRLSGVINVGETNLNLNTAGGAVSAAPIPPIRHIGQTAAQTATRARAGLVQTAGTSGSGSGNMELDLTINAPRKIFARGRGLNAELGGAITLRGTTARPTLSGQIALIRGTFDILGRRLNLDDGRITLLGDFTPYLDFSSSTSTEQGTATLSITGRADAPQIEVTSDPSRPSEEALALLLFGENIQDLSPLALARLASSALTLSGRGGQAREGVRKATGVDSVDLGADNLGSGRLGLGGYLADNVYTDFNINTAGDSELSINLDLSRTLTATGTVTSEGETGLGLFFKRDY